MSKPKAPNEPDLSELDPDAEIGPQEKQIMQLQAQLTAEKDLRKEERFVSGFIVLIIFNIMLFNVIGGLSAFALSVFQLLLVIPIARKMGLQEIARMFDKVLSALTANFKD